MKKNQSSKRKLPNTWKKRDTIWAIMASICILIFVIHYSTLFVSASSSSAPLPLTNYTAPTYLTDEDISYFNSIITTKPSLFGNHTVDLTTDGIVCFNVQLDRKAVGQRQYEDVMGYVFYKPYSYSVTVSNYDTFNLFSTDTITLTFYGYESWQFWHCVPGYSNGVNGWMGAYQSQGNTANISLFGLGNSVTITNTFRNPDTFIPGYPIYWSNPFYNGGSSIPVVNQPILAYGKPGYQVQEGHATDTGNINSIDNDWSPRPSKPSQPTPTIHTWPTPPPIDTSTIESLLESIHDLLSWLSDNLQDEFSNLISNIGNWFSYLTDLISYFFLSVLDTLNNLKDFLYDNFVSLFEAISNNISYLVEPVQSDDILQSFEGTNAHQDFESMTDLVNDSFDIFDTINEPNSFAIPIHLENLPMLNCGTQYIDLGWFDSCKTALRAFMWCVTTFGLLYTIIDAIPSYISGGDE